MLTCPDFWIIGLILTASILIYGIGNKAGVAYVDCLVFASGANTQAGLNTVDVATLSTFQQVVIYICAGLANPITVNSMVVFLRLYWFQKRFQNIVRDAKRNRTSINKSRSKSKPPHDTSALEKGVDPSIIHVRHGKRHRIANDGVLLSEAPALSNSKHDSSSDNNSSEDTSAIEKKDSRYNPHPVQPTAITFAQTVKRSDGVKDDAIKIPMKRSDEEHIAILHRQRNLQTNEILRIPNPRDVERGIRPKVVSEGDGPDPEDEEEDIHRRAVSIESKEDSRTLSSIHSQPEERTSYEVTRRQTITIEEPDRRKRDELVENTMAITNTFFSPLRFRKNRKSAVDKGKEPLHLKRKNTINVIKTALSREKLEDAPYLSWQPTMGRNSQFVGLNEEQRDELGGIEYRSLKTLALILLCYFWGFELLSLTFLLPYILHNDKYGQAVEAWGVNRTWWGFFTAHSAFQDLGFTLTPDSMASFSTSRYVLLIMSFFIVIGNTGFPIMLRVIIWLTSKLVPRESGLWEELRFLLDHPRRCFTLLFPSKATMWLFWVLLILNGVDLFFFIVLDLPGHTLDFMPVSLRFLNGWFVATCTRTAGFSSIAIGILHPAVQISYMIMMYISIFPIAISIRRTNVYEEQSLGVYSDNPVPDMAGDGEPSYVGSHLRRQLSFDLWFLFLCYFLLAISEGGRLQANDPDFNMFSLLFECVSAYGTVGLSLGYPNFNTSFCGQFTTVGKLLIIALQIRGRHRGLPYGLDKAILLPSESLNKKEDLVVEDGAGLSNTISHATGFSLARGRTRSVEKPNQPQSFLSRVMQPGPAVVHPHFETLSLYRTATERSHLGYAEPKRANTDPVGSDDEDILDLSHQVARQSLRRAETMPLGKSLHELRSNGHSSNNESPNAAASAHSLVLNDATFDVAPKPCPPPTFSTEPTAVDTMALKVDEVPRTVSVNRPVAAGEVIAHDANAIQIAAMETEEPFEKASVKSTSSFKSAKSSRSAQSSETIARDQKDALPSTAQALPLPPS